MLLKRPEECMTGTLVALFVIQLSYSFAAWFASPEPELRHALLSNLMLGPERKSIRPLRQRSED